jgi:hypothetical protein
MALRPGLPQTLGLLGFVSVWNSVAHEGRVAAVTGTLEPKRCSRAVLGLFLVWA